MVLSYTSSQSLIVLLVPLAFGLLFKALSRPTITRDGICLRKPPGTLPFVGNGIIFLQQRENLFSWFTKCIHLYGHETLGITVPSLPPGVIISDPVNLEYVFKHDRIFEKGKFFKDRLQDLFGNGIVNADGDLWKRQRKAGSQFFTTGNMKLLANVELPKLLEGVIGHLDSIADGQTMVDLADVIYETTTQLMGKMAYGMEMHANDEFTLAFDYASGVVAERFQNPLWYLTEILTGHKLRKAIQTMNSYGRYLVKHALTVEDSDNSGDSNGDGKTSGRFISALYESLGDETLVADSALNYLSAGKDTVAQAITWTFYLLMKHREVGDKLHEVTKEINSNELRNVLTMEELTPNTASYTMAAFYESLRLYPPIPFEIKQAQEDTTLPDGTFLPKSSIVVWCSWAMNRSRSLWGSDADEYRPERWLVDGHFVQKSAAEFPVFQGGPRLCLGKRMAELVAVQVLATLTARFEFLPAYEGDKVSRTHLTLPMEGGLQVYVKHRPLNGETI